MKRTHPLDIPYANRLVHDTEMDTEISELMIRLPTEKVRVDRQA